MKPEPTDKLEEKLSRVLVILDDLMARGGEVSMFARDLAASLVPGPDGSVDVEALFFANKPMMLAMRGFEQRPLVVAPAVIAELSQHVIDSGPGKALELQLRLIIEERDIVTATEAKYAGFQIVQRRDGIPEARLSTFDGFHEGGEPES